MELLDAHQAARATGVPTVSVGVGPSGDVLARLREWAKGCGRPVVLWRAAEREQLGAQTLVAVEPGVGLKTRAARALEQAGFQPDELRARPPIGPEQRMLASRLDDQLSIALAIVRGDPWKISWTQLPAFLRGLETLCPPNQLPLLIGMAEPQEALSMARMACTLAVEVPTWPVALCLDPSGWRMNQATLDDREHALLRQGLFEVDAQNPETSDPTLVDHPLSQMGVAQAHIAAVSSWTGGGASPSVPEQFLASVLDDLVETAGLFQLHGCLPIRFGSHDIEVDLLCGQHRLAIEVDGWHHFQDPEHYRRDRRKDVLLQQHGFLVLRFLADDVVARMEEILFTIKHAVRNREGGTPWV